MHLKLHQKERLKKIAEEIGDLIENKIADKFTRASKPTPKNNLETNEEEILRGNYISITKTKKYWWSKIKVRKLKTWN